MLCSGRSGYDAEADGLSARLILYFGRGELPSSQNPKPEKLIPKPGYLDLSGWVERCGLTCPGRFTGHTVN